MTQIVTNQKCLIKEWLELESVFSANHYNSIFENDALFVDHKPDSSKKVVFCAPHALNHYRDNKLKIADIYTGSLCQLLAKYSNQAGLVAISPINESKSLGHCSKYLDYVKHNVSQGALIVDVHGMSDTHGYDICIGTGPNPSTRVEKLAQKITNDLSDYNISINYPFDASSDYTMTNHIQTSLGGDSIQIEISSNLRRPDCDSESCRAFLHKTIDIINDYIS